MIVIDEKGNEVDGDAVMALCATRMHRRGQLAKGTLVSTVMSNLGLELYLKDIGLSMVRETGAMMTAVVLAGRTGAAFAATFDQLYDARDTDEFEFNWRQPFPFAEYEDFKRAIERG